MQTAVARPLMTCAVSLLLLSCAAAAQTTKAADSMTAGLKNDGERAVKMLTLSRETSDPNRRVSLLEWAVEYGTHKPLTIPGRNAADDALSQLALLDPGRAMEHMRRRLELCRSWAVSASTPEEKQSVARRQLGASLALAGLLEARGAYEEASTLYRQSLGIIESFNMMSLKETFEAGQLRVRAMADAVKAVETLRAKFKDNPDANTRVALVTLLAGYLDDPNAAAACATADIGEPHRSCWWLLGKPVDKLVAEDAMKLAVYYHKELMPRTPAPLRPRLEDRMLSLYRQVLSRDVDDALSAEARTDLNALEDVRAQRAMKPRPDTVATAKRIAALPDAKRLDALKAAMRQYNGNVDVDIQAVTKAMDALRIEDNGAIITLEPLYGWPMTSLTLAGCLGLESLDGLQGSRTLSSMIIRYCPSLRTLIHLKGKPLESLEIVTATNLASLEGLKGAPLKSLMIHGVPLLTDLSPLTGDHLQRLVIDGCPTVTDLKALAGQPLERLDLIGFRNLGSLAAIKGAPLRNVLLRDCSALETIEGLEQTPLVDLGLTRCRSVKSLKPLKDCRTLESLDISGCTALTSLAGIEGLPIKKLYIEGLKAVDIDTIETLPLEELHGAASLSKDDRQRLAKIPTLKKITD